MQQHDRSLHPSKSGVLFIGGFDTSLRVRRAHLVVRSLIGRERLETVLPRVTKPRLRRVVIVGSGGYTTWEALAWLDGVGASFVHLARDGRVLAASAEAGPNQPALRRAQVLAADSETGTQIVRDLLVAKVAGQASVLEEYLPEARALAAVNAAEGRLVASTNTREALVWEAKAAAAYWRAWTDVRVSFARADAGLVPEAWSTFGDRQSPLSTSPRKAVGPPGAILNYLYALAESECRIALLAVGLDPGLGWAHQDASYRDAAALDLLEPLRPDVDRYVLRLLSTRTFSRQEFVELPTGQVRLAPPLARTLAEATLPMWEAMASPVVERIARLLAASVSARIRVPGRSTRGARGKGRTTLSRRSSTLATKARIASACRICGVILDSQDRVHCDKCLPQFEAERTTKLVTAAQRVLRQMRSAANDPAKSPEAIAKRTAVYRQRRAAAREWFEQNPGPHDRERYRSEIWPGLARITLPAMMRATGLSSAYCWNIRLGNRIPHPMYWEMLEELITDAAPSRGVAETVE